MASNAPKPQAQGGRNPRTLWQSYMALPSRTRLYFGLAIGVTGAIGLAVADKLQEIMPPEQAQPGTSQAESESKTTPAQSDGARQ